MTDILLVILIALIVLVSISYGYYLGVTRDRNE